MTKSAFLIRRDTSYQDHLQDFPERESGPIFNRWIEACRALEPVSSWWSEIPVYVRNPDMPASDFFGAPVIGRFGLSERVYADTTMRHLLESVGELLPMRLVDTGGYIYVFNPLRPARKEGLVDLARCERKWGHLSKLAFFDDKLPDGGVFTIPENVVGVYVSHSESYPPETDFIQWYQRQGYSGLLFLDAEQTRI